MKGDWRLINDTELYDLSKDPEQRTNKEAKINIQDIELSKNVDANAEYIEFTVALKKGTANLNTVFTLDNNEKLGAFL